jgi:ABC-2 type transport system permease protein
MLAGEAAAVTLRTMLTRPFSRSKLVLAKYFAAMIYTAALIFWMALISLVLGVLIMGTGDLIVIRNTIYVFSENDVLWRLALAFSFGLLAMWCVSALAFMFSSFTSNSIGPIILTMTVIISFIVISAIDLSIFRVVKPFLFTTYMGSWKLFFEEPLQTAEILISSGVLALHAVVFLMVSLFHFNRKDILT